MVLKRGKTPWNKGLSGEEYRKHYPSGFKTNPFPKGHRIHVGRKLSEDHKDRISKSLKGKNKGVLNNMWRGGRMKNSNGYIQILKPYHPHCDSKGYMFEHRLIMEKHLGRYLGDSETVHHINENKVDNSISNLMLFPNRGAHMSFHRKLQTMGAREMVLKSKKK